MRRHSSPPSTQLLQRTSRGLFPFSFDPRPRILETGGRKLPRFLHHSRLSFDGYRFEGLRFTLSEILRQFAESLTYQIIYPSKAVLLPCFLPRLHEKVKRPVGASLLSRACNWEEVRPADCSGSRRFRPQNLWHPQEGGSFPSWSVLRK